MDPAKWTASMWYCAACHSLLYVWEGGDIWVWSKSGIIICKGNKKKILRKKKPVPLRSLSQQQGANKSCISRLTQTGVTWEILNYNTSMCYMSFSCHSSALWSGLESEHSTRRETTHERDQRGYTEIFIATTRSLTWWLHCNKGCWDGHSVRKRPCSREICGNWRTCAQLTRNP